MQGKSATRGSGLPCLAATTSVPPREKFDYWHDVVCRNLVDLDYGLIGDGPFEATFSGVMLGALNVSRVEASPHSASRSLDGIARTGSETLVIIFVLAGHLIAEQDGRIARLAVGEGTVCDAERPYLLHSDQPFEIACLQVPRQSVASGIGGLQRLMAMNFSEKSNLCPLVFSYVVRLVESASLLEGVTTEKISRNFVDLLSAMLAEISQTHPLPLSEYRSLALIRVKDFIERHFGDFELDPSMVAANLKLSQRYMNQLLESEGTSLSRYIWRRRLERTAQSLRDPALRSRSISMIALDNGFNDLSHFSKAFRQCFELSPRDYRRTHGP
jgi:AraC-like DNA-binding protein